MPTIPLFAPWLGPLKTRRSVVVSDVTCAGTSDLSVHSLPTNHMSKMYTEDFDNRHEYSTGMLNPLTAILVWKISYEVRFHLSCGVPRGTNFSFRFSVTGGKLDFFVKH